MGERIRVQRVLDAVECLPARYFVDAIPDEVVGFDLLGLFVWRDGSRAHTGFGLHMRRFGPITRWRIRRAFDRRELPISQALNPLPNPVEGGD